MPQKFQPKKPQNIYGRKLLYKAILGDQPVGDLIGWEGYFHNTDPTIMKPNTLQFPSKNCFIPNKDKIIPRKGKTLLGQSQSLENVDIGFNNFTQGEKDAGDITEFTPAEFSSNADSSVAFNSSIQIDSTHYLNFWGGVVHDGFAYAQVFEMNLNTGIMTPHGTPVLYANNFKGYNSCGQVDANHFINFWTDDSFHGFTQIFEVDITSFAITLKSTPLTFFAGGTFYNSCVKVDGSHFLNFWQDADALDGKAQVFAINLGTWAITAVGAPLVFEATNVTFNSCGQVDASHFVNFYSNNASHGRAIVVAVNLGTYAVTVFIAAITFDAVANSGNSCVKVDSTHFLNCWRGTTGTGLARVFSISIGGVSITALASAFTFDAGPDVKAISVASFGDGINFINFWSNISKQYAQILSIDATAGTFEALGSSLNFGLNSGVFNSVVSCGDGINFINFWAEHTNIHANLGEMALFKTELVFTSKGIEHICAGDNRILFVSVLTRNTVVAGGGDRVTGVKYNGVAMTLAEKVALDTQRERYIFYLVNPAAGIMGSVNGVVVSCNSINRSLIVAASSYFGAKQTIPTIMSQVGPNAGVSNISISEIPTLDKSWIVAFFCGGASYTGGLTEALGTHFRGGNTNFQMADKGPISPAASTTLEAVFASPTDAIAFAIAFAPKGGTPATKAFEIIGHKKRFTNDGGYTLEVRIKRTTNVGMGDQLEVLFPNPLTGVLQWYSITERANPLLAGVGDRYFIDEFFDTNLNPAISRRNSRLIWVNGTKTIFSWSGGVAPINSIIPGIGITSVSDQTWISLGFPYFYSNPLSSEPFTEIKYVVINAVKYKVLTNGANLTLNTIVGTFQIGDVVTGSSSGATGKVASVFGSTIFLSGVTGIFNSFDSITGSISTATAKVSSTTINDGGWDTNTLLLENTNGITVGDVALAWIAPPGSSIVMQDTITLPDTFPVLNFCRQNKNYMFYGSYQSRQLFMSNNFNRAPIESIAPFASTIYVNDLYLPPTPDFSGSAITIFTITIDSNSAPDTFKWTATQKGITIAGQSGVPITTELQTLSSIFGNIGIIFASTTHAVGDSWNVTASPGVGDANFFGDVSTPPAWANFFYNIPRIPGQGYIFPLPANFWAMEPQEGDMYINDQFGSWGFVNTQVAADLLSETISFTPLKQVSASKVIFPYMISHLDNALIFVTENKTLDMIERQQFLELPQIGYLSQPVQKDFEALSFHKGSMEYLGKRLNITSPEDDTMMVYDNQAGNKYWQPPQDYSENGILSIVANTLISHSNLRDVTYNLFTGEDDNGNEFEVIMRTAYDSFGNRWGKKNSNKSFLEGYIGGLPPLVASIYLGVDGCGGIFPHSVEPIVCRLPDNAPLGQGNLGSHPLGSSTPENPLTYFQEIHAKYQPILQYFFAAFELSCKTKKHSYEVLSMGLNSVPSSTGNSELIPEEEISKV